MNEFDTPERRTLRESCRRFVHKEIVPNLDRWERDGEVPRELHKAAAAAGLLGVGYPRGPAARAATRWTRRWSPRRSSRPGRRPG